MRGRISRIPTTESSSASTRLIGIAYASGVLGLCEREDADDLPCSVEHGPSAVALEDALPLEVEHVVIDLRTDLSLVHTAVGRERHVVVQPDERLTGHVDLAGGGARGERDDARRHLDECRGVDRQLPTREGALRAQ